MFKKIAKGIGRTLFSLIAVAVCSVLFSAALLVPYAEAKTADPERVDTVHAEYIKGDVYLDGKLIYGWTMEDPPVTVDGTFYIPLRMSRRLPRPEIPRRKRTLSAAPTTGLTNSQPRSEDSRRA